MDDFIFPIMVFLWIVLSAVSGFVRQMKQRQAPDPEHSEASRRLQEDLDRMLRGEQDPRLPPGTPPSAPTTPARPRVRPIGRTEGGDVAGTPTPVPTPAPRRVSPPRPVETQRVPHPVEPARPRPVVSPAPVQRQAETKPQPVMPQPSAPAAPVLEQPESLPRPATPEQPTPTTRRAAIEKMARVARRDAQRRVAPPAPAAPTRTASASAAPTTPAPAHIRHEPRRPRRSIALPSLTPEAMRQAVLFNEIYSQPIALRPPR